MTIDWKQNFRKTPYYVRNRLSLISGNDIVVSCVKMVPLSDIVAGKYNHMGIGFDGNQLEYKTNIVPRGEVGKYSDMNRHGHIIVRTDLPKIFKITHYVTLPNFGDWSRGSHEVPCEHFVYQREYHPPRELEIIVSLLREELRGNERCFYLLFRVDEVLDKTGTDFNELLLYDLNLLMENIGVVDVAKSDTGINEYLNTTFVNWEILPIGNRETTLDRILRKCNPSGSPDADIIVRERIEVLMSLSPQSIIVGANGFRRYFGAQFSHDLVVFESPQYGNAIYVMFEAWGILSQMTRLQLMGGGNRGFERIPHGNGWDSKLRKIVRTKLWEGASQTICC